MPILYYVLWALYCTLTFLGGSLLFLWARRLIADVRDESAVLQHDLLVLRKDLDDAHVCMRVLESTKAEKPYEPTFLG